MINYFDLLNGFWKSKHLTDLTPSDKVVYLCVLDYCNKIGWANPFRMDWEIVVSRTGVSRNTFYKSIKRLDEVNIIKYTPGRINLAMKVELMPFKKDSPKKSKSASMKDAYFNKL